MKGIIVGTDFSESSINALKHATTIADKAKCDITLIWVKTPGTTLGLLQDNINEYLQVAKDRLDQIADDHKTMMPKGKSIKTKIIEGKVHLSLAREAEETDADLVVVGAHGISGHEEFFIGNSAYRTVMTAKCPVLTIRADTSVNRALTDIVVPIDNLQDTRQKLPVAVKFAKLFAAKIHILGLYTSSNVEFRNIVNAYVFSVEKYLKEKSIRFQVYKRESFNGAETTMGFAKEINASLIVIMREQGSEIGGLWLGNQARELVNNSKLPILSVATQDILGLSK